MATSKLNTKRLPESYAQQGNPNGWFEEFYAKAKGNIQDIYWV